uniref:Uncharacterized protein n=1 Tax=Nelumbo nucifera TaxID=4432 RepID=A0A822Z5C1_NELNU|nr:TPA_asm: hypothetical protein HUJ06_014086 [Nelumbo nucifera]
MPLTSSPFLSSNSNSSNFRQDPSLQMHGNGLNLVHSLFMQSSPSLSLSWTASTFSYIPNDPNHDDLVSPSSNSFASYSARINGINNMVMGSRLPTSSLLTTTLASPFYGGGSDLIDEFHLQDQLSFLNDDSPTHGLKNMPLLVTQ